MGCSSSTQTLPQGNRPPARAAESNGPKKSASEGSDQIIDDIETIPDQTKLTENEPSTAEELTEAVEAIECDGVETLAPAPEESNTTCAPSPAEEPALLITDQDNSVVEGEIEDAVGAERRQDIASERPETKENETGHPGDAAQPEITNVEE